jgi:hypothetical protein
MKKFICLIALLMFTASPFAQTRDMDMDWDVKRVWFPNTVFAHGDTSGAVLGYLKSYGTGAVGMNEISTFGLAGQAMATGAYLTHVLPFPADLDKNYPIAYRVWYTTESTGNDGAIDWRLTMGAYSYGLTELIISPEGAGTLDVIAFAADSASVQYGVTTTAWDTVGTDSLNAAGTYSQDALMVIGVELDDSGDASTGELIFLGLEAAYVPKRTLGSGMGSRKTQVYVRGGQDHGSGLGISLPRKP